MPQQFMAQNVFDVLTSRFHILAKWTIESRVHDMDGLNTVESECKHRKDCVTFL